MQKKYKKWHLLLLLCGLSISVNAQNQGLDFWTCVDNYYGTDHQLVSGRLYTPTRPRANGHPYFLQEQWAEGDLYWHGKHYPGVLLKYNIVDKKLILRQNLQDGLPVTIIVAEEFVDSFRIQSHLFVPKNQLAQLKEETGYLEQIYRGKIAAYRAYEKIFIANYSTINPNGKYSSSQQDFLLVQDNDIHKAKNQRGFLSFFGSKKKQVKKYCRQQRLQLKSASPTALFDLMKYCNEEI